MFGAGLLVGTALAVIIPEGVRSLVVENAPHSANNAISNPAAAAHEEGAALTVIGYCLVLGFIFMLVVDQVSGKRAFLFQNFYVMFYFAYIKTFL